MTNTVNGRTVMIRPWYSVPAVPAETLKQAFGDRTVDSRVELVALIIEYWARSGAKPSLMRVKVLEAVQGRINSGNIFDIISLLAKRGFADEFFDLTRSSVDTDGALRAFLLSNGVPTYTIRHYASWNGIDPKLFLDGFFVGIGESAASIVVDLWQLVKLMIKMQQEQLRTMMLFATDVEAGVQSLREQVETIGQGFNAMVEELDPRRLPARVVDTWKQWNRDFEKHLEELDPFSAGRLLGRIAGDLFQLLTGIVAVVQLLKITARLALRYGPLLIGSVRRVAAEAGVVIRELAALMADIGSAVVDGTARVGLGVLRTLFPPRVLRQLIEEGRALLMHNQLSLFPVFEEAHALSFPGVGMRTPFGVLVANEGRPILMATMSEKLPAAGSVATRREARAAIDEILDQLDELIRDPKAPQLPVSEAAGRAAAQVLLSQRLDTFLRKILNEVAYAAFADLRKSGRKFFAHELGKIIHQRMASRVATDIAQVAPGVMVRTEKQLRTLVKELSAVDREVQTILQGAERRCNETVAVMLARRPDVMDLVGIPPKAAARSEKAVAAYLRKNFGWGPQTAIGDLQSDLILVDTKVKRLINVDYTSSTRADRFEQTWRKVVDDLGGKFSGNWDSVAEAYKKAGKGAVPEEVKSGLEALTRHAVRETVIRKVALEEIFGKLWHVSSHEMMYDGLGKLWASVKKAPAGRLP